MRRLLLPGHVLFSRPKKMHPAGIPKSAVDFALSDICVPLCILKTSYYVPACEKDGKTPSRGEGAGSSAIFLCPPTGILSEILPCIVPPTTKWDLRPCSKHTYTHIYTLTHTHTHTHTHT